ncbi:O-antigen ligase family protein [Granulosicoccus sp.]|nr:O-antigen ligase [Granulosicoccus sp.]MDB4223330.1 O-antigen ligase family protein [Granulosicoccus sp.]
MRVATYTQPTAATRGSIFAHGILVLTILLGTGVIPTIAVFTGGPLEKVLTPLWLMLYLLSFMGLMFNHGVNWISWLVRYRILLVFLILGTVMSVSWSIDAQVSAERTVHLFGSTLIAIYIGFTVPLLTTLRVFAVVLAFCLLASFGAVVGLPDLGIENYEGSSVWRGVFNSKNDLGFWSGVGVLLFITLSDSTQSSGFKLICFLMAGVSLALLGLSHSATSLLAMLVAGTLSLYLFIASRFQLSFIRMAVMAILFTAVLALAIANIETAELVGRTNDLTGRGEVWKQTWKLILEKPLTGVGYGSLWYPTDDTLWIQQSLTDFTWVVYHAHNGLLQVASEVGLPLALIAILMVAQQLIEIFYCQYERQQVGVLFVLAFVTAYLISNFSEARFLVNRELFWIFFLALPISMLRQINLVSTDIALEADNSPTERPVVPQAYSAVPGKPWLGPMPSGTSKPAVAAAAAVAAVPYLPSAPKTPVVAKPEPAQGAEISDHDLADNQQDLIDFRESSGQDELLYNDTLEIDRYDMDFESANEEWVDIALTEDDR